LQKRTDKEQTASNKKEQIKNKLPATKKADLLKTGQVATNRKKT